METVRYFICFAISKRNTQYCSLPPRISSKSIKGKSLDEAKRLNAIAAAAHAKNDPSKQKMGKDHGDYAGKNDPSKQKMGKDHRDYAGI